MRPSSSLSSIDFIYLRFFNKKREQAETCGEHQMDSARSWFKKFHKDKERPRSNKDTPPGYDHADDAPSSNTKEKVAAAKQYIENHYKSQMKSLQDRKERQVKIVTSYTCNVNAYCI